MPRVMISRVSCTDWSLLISAWKPQPILTSTCSSGAPSGSSKISSGNCAVQVAEIAAVNSVSLSVKWL
ncbi:hypothetical protein D3C80_2133720 [compost metagenome]